MVAIGQSSNALDSLSILLLSSKYPLNFAVPNSSSTEKIENYAVETDLERITLKIIELAVELGRGRLIKEVLLHVRGALQVVHQFSYEFILRFLISKAEIKKEEDKEFVDNETNEKVVDLDETCGVLVDSTLRFFWEILRIVLDISRNNSKLEQIYHDTVLKAFQFCRQFGRKNEFRRLSEMVRYHLALSVKYPGQVNAVPLATSTESHQLALELRFNQLTLACDLELWQEAFRTVEDIYGLQVLARKSVRQLTAPEYFDKLARIFAKSDNFLFLAATLLRQPPSQLKMEQKEILVMATLAIPSETFGSEEEVNQSERLAQIIGLPSMPTRELLLKTIQQRDILNDCSSNLVELFKSMEKMTMTSSSSSGKEEINHVLKGVEALENLVIYNSNLKPFLRGCYENLSTFKVRKNLKTLDSISLKELSKQLCIERVRGSGGLFPKFNLEMFLLRKNNFKGIKIDHVTGMLLIDRSIHISNLEPFEGINVDSSMSWSYLHSEMKKLLKIEETAKVISVSQCGNLAALLKKEHQMNLERRILIEKRKEILEAAAEDKERREARERAIKSQQEFESEKLRQAEEIGRRDLERLERERIEIRRLEAEKREMEHEKLKEAAGARLNREKIGAQAVRLDYLERALREQEIPLLEADYAKQKKNDLIAYEEKCKLILDLARAKHARDLEIKKKFIESTDLISDYSNFLSSVRERRNREFEERKIKAALDLEAEKTKRRLRIAGEMEARRKIEAERELARSSMFTEASTSGTGTGKYIPPSKLAASAAGATGWRRAEVTSPVISSPVISTSTSVSASPISEEPKKSTYVPIHKRKSALN